MALKIEGIIAAFIGIVIGISLVDPIADIANASNITGAAATLLGLVPLFFVVGIILIAIRGMIGKGK